MAQRKLPVSQDDIILIIKNEGIPISQIEANSKGFDFYVQSINVSAYCSDGLPMDVVFQLNELKSGSEGSSTLRLMNGTVSIQVNSIYRLSKGEPKFTANNSGINLGRTIDVKYHVFGHKFPQLSKFTENNVILCLGDSIDVLNAYVTRAAGHRNYQMLRSLRGAGYDCRLASLAISGNSLDQFVGYFKDGYSNASYQKADVILIQHGANDIGQNVTDTKFSENLLYMKTYRDENYPNAKLVFVQVAPSNISGAYATDGTIRNARQVTFNTLIRNFVLANPNSNIYTIDCYTGFPMVSTNWADGVHFTQAGHDILAPMLANGMKTILGLT